MARVAREEGFRKLFSGVDWATGRAVSRIVVYRGVSSCEHMPLMNQIREKYTPDEIRNR